MSWVARRILHFAFILVLVTAVTLLTGGHFPRVFIGSAVGVIGGMIGGLFQVFRRAPTRREALRRSLEGPAPLGMLMGSIPSSQGLPAAVALPFSLAIAIVGGVLGSMPMAPNRPGAHP